MKAGKKIIPVILVFIFTVAFFTFFPAGDLRAKGENEAGRVSGVEGDVKLKRGNANPAKPRIFEPVNKGDKLYVTGTSSVRILYYKDNHEEEVKGHSVIEITSDGARLIKGSQKNIAITRKPPHYALCVNPSESGRSIAAGRVRNAGTTLLADLMEATTTPTFTWSFRGEPEKYRFELKEFASEEPVKTKTVIDTVTTADYFTVPGKQALQFGRKYLCTVETIPRDTLSPLNESTDPYVFTLPSPDTVNYLKQEEKKLYSIKKYTQQWVSTSLGLIISYMEFGITDKAGSLAKELYENLSPEDLYLEKEGSLKNLIYLYYNDKSE